VQMDASDSKAPMYPQNKLCALHDVTIQNLTISGTSSILHSFIFCTSIVSCTEHNVTTTQTTAVWKVGWQNAGGFLLLTALPTNRSKRHDFLSLTANVYLLKVACKIIKTMFACFQYATGSNM
jgi:hypothetical protein